jgi:hypothetical protein
MRVRHRLTVCFAAPVLALALGITACGTAPSEESAVASSAIDGQPIPPAELAVQSWSRATTSNAGIACSNAVGGFGFVVFPQLSTGQSVVLFGAGAHGQITVPGASGAQRPGQGNVFIGAGTAWDPSTQAFTPGGAVLGSDVVDTGASMPADPASAEALFDEVLGPGARHGIRFTEIRWSGEHGSSTVLAYYGTGVIDFGTLESGQPGRLALALGIVRTESKVVAIDLNGTGLMSSYVR